MPEKPDLDALRVRINELDKKLVSVISERAKIVVDIGKLKRGSGAPIYAPHREREVLDRVLASNDGPLPDKTIEAIYRELMSGSFQLEQPLKIAHLAPVGSFSHIASIRHFGSSVQCVGVPSIDRVFREVAAKHCTYGLVPYENSTSGGVTDTLDAFQEHHVTIYAEALIEVKHCLLCNGPTESITKIASKPQVITQCRKWLNAMFPNVEIIETVSSSQAVKIAATDTTIAAIGSAYAAMENGVEIAIEDVHDRAENITRFLILSKEVAEPTKDDKTTIMFTTKNKPGALVDVLAAFRDNGINLSHIDKCPSGRVNWNYTFFIDADANQNNTALQGAIEIAQKHCNMFEILGSYPRTSQVL